MSHDSRCLACALLAAVALLTFTPRASPLDIHFDYASFDNPNTPGVTPHFGQAQFNVLNYPSINGNYMMTSTDNHRPETLANHNDLAEFYNNFLADYNTQYRGTGLDAVAEADAINTYTVNNSAKNGPRPTWLILNELSATIWPDTTQKGIDYRTWVLKSVTRLHDVYGYTVVTYSPFQTVGTGRATSWQALAAKSYIAIEDYLSGQEVMSGGSNYATRVAWAQSQYQQSMDTYITAGVPQSRLFTSEDFANTTSDKGFGRAGISSSDWDSVLQIRQDAIYNVGFAGFLAYSWGANGMGITEAEQIQHEYYYRSRRVLQSQKPQWLSDSAINLNGTTIPISWNQPLNWLGGVPNGTSAEVNFWRTLTANRTITLDGSKTVGTLTFDSPFSYTIDSGTGGSLVFNNSHAFATLTSSQGNHTINTPVQLATGLYAVIDAGTFNVTGNVSGPGSLIKTGAGTLAFTGANSFTGNTTVQNGVFRLGRASLADTSNVYLLNGGTLDLNFTGTDLIHALYFNGVSQSAGIWGAFGSGAQFTSPSFTGTGLLNVTMYVPPAQPMPPGHIMDDFEVNEGHFAWPYNTAPTQTYG